LTRIQLNLLGRRNYLASVVTLASPAQQGARIQLENNDDDNFEHAYGNDFDTNRKYLSFSWWLLHKGCREILEKVSAAVKEVFGPLNPREDISLQRLSELTIEVRKKIEGSTEDDRRTKTWLSFLLPPPTEEGHVLRESGMISSTDDTVTSTSPSLRRLLDETSDLCDSPTFTHVLTLLLDAGFSLLIDTHLSHAAFKIPLVSHSSSRIQELVDPASANTKVAHTLAVFCRQAHNIGSGEKNDYLAAMESVRDLEAFAAVVYSSNFEFEAPEPVIAGFAERGLGETYEDLSYTRPPTADMVGIPSTVSIADLADKTSAPVAEDTEDVVKQPDEQPPPYSNGEATAVGAETGPGAESSLEAAWGKALAKEDGRSE